MRAFATWGRLVLAVLICLASSACSRNKQPAAPAAAAAECYSIDSSTTCPPDSTDPSGKGLPTAGGVCRLDPCRPCGSASAPAFRDRAGAPQPGWCICVPRSDDSGAVYSCFGLEDWRQRR